MGRSGLGPWLRRLEPSPRAVSGSTAKIEVCQLALEAWIDMSPARSLSRLDWSWTVTRGARAMWRALSGSPEAQT